MDQIKVISAPDKDNPYAVIYKPKGLPSAPLSDDDKEICIVRVLGKMETIPFPPLQQLINETRERFKSRPLTHEERLQYFLE